MSVKVQTIFIYYTVYLCTLVENLKQEMLRDETKVKSYWNEQWKKIETKAPTLTSDYYISNHGRIKSIKKESTKERLCKCTKMKTGYMKYNIRLINSKSEDFYVHRLVGQYFVEKEFDEQVFVVHIDGNKEHNFYENIKWLSREQLNARWSDLGTYKINTSHKSVKLTESKVLLLKQRLKRGKTKKRILAKQFDISLTQLKRIERGENWGHVKV